jgi:putative tryptophan/tyrosine transport system substrate-binding protein
MNRKITVLTLSAMLFALWASAEAQQAKKIPRMGFLGGNSHSVISARMDAFRQGLRDLGYIEGENILAEYRWADGKSDRLPELAAELVRLKVEIIVTQGTQATIAAARATNTIPIVTVGAGDLVGEGLVASLARPGGNVTGATNIDPDLSAKRLELLKETFPKLSRVAVLYHGGPGGSRRIERDTDCGSDFGNPDSTIGGKRSQSVFGYIRRNEAKAGGCAYHLSRYLHCLSPRTTCGACDKEPLTDNVR